MNNKTKIAIDRIRTFDPDDGYILCFSGGKDSVVIKHEADLDNLTDVKGISDDRSKSIKLFMESRHDES